MARPMHGRHLTLEDLSEDERGLGDTIDSFEHTLWERDPNGVAIGAEGARLQTNGDEIEGAVGPEELIILNDNIGRGACSQVQLAKSRTDGLLYALKIFNIFDGPKRRQLFTEVKSLWNVHCPALISFFGAYLDSGRVCCILEYMDCGTLEDIYYKLPGDMPIPEDVLASLAYQMLWGLAFLQHDNQLHRDVKPANVLVNRRGESKLSDFGIARRMEDNALAQTVTGTFKYMSPERLNGDQYSFNSDVWSVGVILLEGARKRYPFGRVSNQIELVQGLQEADIMDIIGSCDLSEKFVSFLGGCLTMESSKRPDAESLLDSPVFAEYDITDYDSAAELLASWVGDCVPERHVEYSDTFEGDAKLVQTLGSSIGTCDDEHCFNTYNSFRTSDDEVSELMADVKELDLRDSKSQYAFRQDSYLESKVAESK